MNRILRLSVSVALLSWVGWRTDWAEVQGSFANMRWELWIGAAALLMVTQVISALRWKCYADQLALRRSLRQLTGFYFIGMFFNLLLPTSVGGDVVRAWYLDGKSGNKLVAFASVFLDRLNGLLVLVALACLAVTVAPLDLPPWITWSVWGIAACGALGLVSLQILTRLASQFAPDSNSKLRVRLDQIRATLGLLSVPRILATTLALSLFVQAANIVIVWLIGVAIHAPIPAAYYWVMVPMVSLLTMLPVSVNGMGVREKATVLFLAPLGIAEGTALTLSMLWFAVYAAVSLLGGAVYYFGHFPKPVTPAVPADAPVGEVTCGSIGDHSDEGRTGQHRHAA